MGGREKVEAEHPFSSGKLPPRCCQFMITHPNELFYARLAWCMRTRVLGHFFPISFRASSLHPQKRKTDGRTRRDHWVVFSLARVCMKHDSPGSRSSLLWGGHLYRLHAYTSLQTEHASNCHSVLCFSCIAHGLPALHSEINQCPSGAIFTFHSSFG